MQPIYRMDGRYFGYLRAGQFLYRHDGVYLGWLTRAGQIFLADGSYLGKYESPSFIVRSAGDPLPPRAVVKPIPPAGKLSPPRLPDRVKTIPAAGVRDALETL